MKQVDVVVVDGGLAGLSCAIELTHQSRSVLLVEPVPRWAAARRPGRKTG